MFRANRRKMSILGWLIEAIVVAMAVRIVRRIVRGVMNRS
jgi:hypothetical protein